jgi:hypothetical protein
MFAPSAYQFMEINQQAQRKGLIVFRGEHLLFVDRSFFLLSFGDRRLFEISPGSEFFQNPSPLKFLLESLQGSVY